MERKHRIGTIGASAAVGLVAWVGLATAQERPGTDVVLPTDVVAAASAFDSYMQHAGELNGRFSDGEGVHRSLRTGSAYEMTQFEEGMIGYGAIIAVRDEAFDDGVERAVRRFGGSRALAQRLLDDPREVLQIDGATDAARQVSAALERRADHVTTAGRSVKQAAYDVQHQAWSKVNVSNPRGRLAEAKALSSARFVATEEDNVRVMHSELNAARVDSGEEAQISPLVVRSLALAAEAVLGEAKGEDTQRLQPLFSESGGAFCLNMAKLNLYQCLAVAGPQYEDLFCLGQHALIDTGQCVDTAARGSRPALSAAT